jgi:hypothetical protein
VHTELTAKETLDFLWSNYLRLIKQVDPQHMGPDAVDELVKENPPVRPFRIASWVTRQGTYISMWSLWEYYARGILEKLPKKEKKLPSESTVTWVGRALATNGIVFKDRSWFAGGNCLRNLIAHNGCRVDDADDEKTLVRAKSAFPNIKTWKDGYVMMEHEQLAELMIKIEDFIELTK